MSYCEIIMFENGKPGDTVQYGNAWGGAAYIWTILFDKYLKDPDVEYDSWLTRGITGLDGIQCLWDLTKREDLLPFERAVHASTFDYAIVLRKNFKQFAEHLREFVAAYPTKGVCHLIQWAEMIESCEAEAIGFYGTSCGDNSWCKYQDDEVILYDLNSQDDHFDIYDDVEWVK